jgi:hypothetical protein
MSAHIALTALETDFGVRPLKRPHRGAQGLLRKELSESIIWI